MRPKLAALGLRICRRKAGLRMATAGLPSPTPCPARPLFRRRADRLHGIALSRGEAEPQQRDTTRRPESLTTPGRRPRTVSGPVSQKVRPVCPGAGLFRIRAGQRSIRIWAAPSSPDRCSCSSASGCNRPSTSADRKRASRDRGRSLPRRANPSPFRSPHRRRPDCLAGSSGRRTARHLPTRPMPCRSRSAAYPWPDRRDHRRREMIRQSGLSGSLPWSASFLRSV